MGQLSKRRSWSPIMVDLALRRIFSVVLRYHQFVEILEHCDLLSIWIPRRNTGRCLCRLQVYELCMLTLFRRRFWCSFSILPL